MNFILHRLCCNSDEAGLQAYWIFSIDRWFPVFFLILNTELPCEKCCLLAVHCKTHTFKPHITLFFIIRWMDPRNYFKKSVYTHSCSAQLCRNKFLVSWCLLPGKISCSAELSLEKGFITSGPCWLTSVANTSAHGSSSWLNGEMHWLSVTRFPTLRFKSGLDQKFSAEYW